LGEKLSNYGFSFTTTSNSGLLRTLRTSVEIESAINPKEKFEFNSGTGNMAFTEIPHVGNFRTRRRKVRHGEKRAAFTGRPWAFLI